MSDTKYYNYTEKCWVLVDNWGNSMCVSNLKARTWRKFINYYEDGEKAVLKEWRRLKREGWQVVRATATYNYQVTLTQEAK